MIYLSWSPALRFTWRCATHDTLAESHGTLDDALYAVNRHQYQYCQVNTDNLAQLQAIDRKRAAGALPDVSGKLTGFKAGAR